jgi:predicted N-acyltransferase
MLEIRLHERVREIAEADWDALALPDESPFVEWTWLDCLEQAGCVGGRSGWHPCHLGVYEISEDPGGKKSEKRETLVAAAPLYRKTNSEGEFVFDWSWADFAQRSGIPYYPKLVCAVPFTPATGARLLVHPRLDAASADALRATIAKTLVEQARPLRVHGIHVLFPAQAEARLFEGAGYLCRYGVQYHWRNRGYAGFEDFLKDLPSKRRTQIRREMRQPERDGVTIETLPEDGYTDEVVESMYQLYLTTVDKFAWGRRYLNRRFFQLVAARFAHRLAWVVARRGGAVIASAFNVRKGPRLYGRYWGTTCELPFLHYNVCYYHGIRDSIAHGLAEFQPGAGGEHKRARGFAPTITYSAHHLQDGRLREILAEFLQRERLAVEKHAAGEDQNDSEE